MQIESNFFELGSKKDTTHLNFFTDSEIQGNQESDNQTTSKNTAATPTLEEYINDKDAYSQVSENDFNLKLEDYNFLWKNKNKLENAGFKSEKINEAIQENDTLQTSDYWLEINKKEISSSYLTNVENERNEKNKEQQNNNSASNTISSKESISKEGIYRNQYSKYTKNTDEKKKYTKKDAKEIKQKQENSRITAERLDTLSQNTGLNIGGNEREKLLKKQEEQDKETQQETSQYKFSKGNISGSISNGKRAISDFNSEKSSGSSEDSKLQSKIDDKNSEITKKANKIDDTRKNALQKMQKATKRSEQLLKKSNNATSKVGLKSLKGKKLKSKQGNSINNSNANQVNANNVNASAVTTTNNSSPGTESAKTSENITNTQSTSNVSNSKDTLVNKSEISNDNSVKQADNVQQTHKAQEQEKIQNTKKKQVQKENAQLVNKQKFQNNEEAQQIGKDIQTQTTQSLKTTEKDFKKVEETCETLNTEKEYYIEQTEKFDREKHKSHGKVNTGICETVIGTSCLICGVGDLICAGWTGIGAAVGIALCVAGVALGAVGICTIHQGNKGHKETYSAGVETTVKERETQKAADDTVKVAEDDEKQARLVEKKNFQQEKQIDDIIKQSEEQESEQKKQEERSNAEQ